MILSEWFALAISVMALAILYLDTKIPKRYGGHTIPKGTETIANHFWTYNKRGKIVPGKGQKRQTIISNLKRILLWTIAIVGIVVFILKKLGW